MDEWIITQNFIAKNGTERDHSEDGYELEQLSA
jgi:hypothetical protein